MNKLKRSHDRKVTNLVNNAGNGSLIQNTFGLPAGKNYSCPGATSICEKVCYAGKLEKKNKQQKKKKKKIKKKKKKKKNKKKKIKINKKKIKKYI